MKKLLLAPVIASLALAPAAYAAKKKTHKVTLNTTILSHSVNPAGVEAGLSTDPTLGSGAVIYTSTGSPPRSTSSFTRFDGRSPIGS